MLFYRLACVVMLLMRVLIQRRWHFYRGDICIVLWNIFSKVSVLISLQECSERLLLTSPWMHELWPKLVENTLKLMWRTRQVLLQTVLLVTTVTGLIMWNTHRLRMVWGKICYINVLKNHIDLFIRSNWIVWQFVYFIYYTRSNWMALTVIDWLFHWLVDLLFLPTNTGLHYMHALGRCVYPKRQAECNASCMFYQCIQSLRIEPTVFITAPCSPGVATVLQRASNPNQTHLNKRRKVFRVTRWGFYKDWSETLQDRGSPGPMMSTADLLFEIRERYRFHLALVYFEEQQ